MHIVVLLILIAIAVAMVFGLRGRPNVQTTDLAELKLRRLEDAVNDAHTREKDQVVVWATGFLNSNPELDLEQIASFMARKWKIDVMMGVGSSALQRVISFGEARIAFEPVLLPPDKGLPGQVRKFPKPVASKEAVGGVLVTATSTGGGAAGSLALSQAVLALVKTCRQVDTVYWMSSENQFSRAEIERKLGVNFRKRWPVDVWVSTESVQNGDDKSDGYTLGLAAMGGTEFEAIGAPESTSDLEERLASIACYVVAHFGVIYNGDTIGIDELERIRLKKVPSETVHKGWVFQLRYEAPSKQSPWR